MTSLKVVEKAQIVDFDYSCTIKIRPFPHHRKPENSRLQGFSAVSSEYLNVVFSK
jgi:hypothetical protein